MCEHIATVRNHQSAPRQCFERLHDEDVTRISVCVCVQYVYACMKYEHVFVNFYGICTVYMYMCSKIYIYIYDSIVIYWI